MYRKATRILVKKDLTSFSELKSNQKYHQFIKKQRKLIYGDKVKFDEDNIVYDLKSNTQTYLKLMFYIADMFSKSTFNKNIKYIKNLIKI